METIGIYFDMLVEFMKQEYMIYGYTFSYWQIFMFVIVAGIVAGFIGEFFNG